MALIFMDGFDGYDDDADVANKWDHARTAEIELQSGGGAFGGDALRIHGTYGYSTPPLAKYINYRNGLGNDLFVTFWAKFNDTSGGVFMMGFGSSHSGQQRDNGRVAWNADKVTLYQNTGPAKATSVASISNGAWVHVSIRMRAGAGGVAEFEVYHDDVLMVDDTTNAYIYLLMGDTGMIHFGGTGTASTGGYWDIDDLVIYDDTGSTMNSHIGLHKIHTLRPTANGSVANNSTLNGGGSSNYEAVDDDPGADTATYLTTSTVGHIDTFEFDAMPEEPSEIFAVQSNIVMYEDATGTTPRTFAHKTVLSATEYDSDDQHTLPLDTYKARTASWEVNPDTAAEWTKSEIDAAEFGFEIKQ